MGEITEYRCPQCGRSFEEMRGALMSDMGPEPAERRERRRLFMRGFRDRLHGIKRAPSDNDRSARGRYLRWLDSTE